MKNVSRTLAMALALTVPGAVYAQSSSTGSQHPTGGTTQGGAYDTQHRQQGSSTGSAPGGAYDTQHRQQGSSTGSAQDNQPSGRGGGSMTGTTSRADQIRSAQPHVVTVDVQFQNAMDLGRGLERLFTAAGTGGQNALPSDYTDHVNNFTQGIQNSLSTARTHLQQLRTSLQNLGTLQRYENDLSQIDQWINRATQDNSAVRQMASQSGAVPAQLRSRTQDLTRDLGRAQSSFTRIERGLR